jgi:hypothetical protein
MKESIQYLYLFILFIIYTMTTSTSAQTLSWQKLTQDINVFDILYDGEQNIYFTGIQLSSYFWRSTNLGNNWTRIGNGSLRLYRIAIDSNGVLWGGNDNLGGIYKSTDQGNHWEPSLSSNDKILSITVSPNNWIWAGTLDGKIIFSSDNGSTWVANQVSSEGFWTIAPNRVDQLFAGDTDGNIYRSTNLGSDWELVYDGELWINGLVIDDSNHIYANDWDTRLISKDNGATWNLIEGLQLGRLFLDKYHNFYSEYGNRSTDNCSTWTFIGPVSPSSAENYAFVDSLVFAGTTRGVFLHDPSYQPYIGDNYFPLTIGNKWQFNRICNNDFAGNTMYSIVRDTIILNQRYFLIQDAVNDWVRYDELNHKFYLRCNDTDFVVMDYTLNEGTTFQHILYNSHSITSATIFSPRLISIFDSTYFSKGYYWGYSGVTLSYHSEGIGETVEEYHYAGPWGQHTDCQRNLIRAIIFDSAGVKYYSDHIKPIINFQPVFITNNFSLSWNFGVDHYYRQFDNTWNENFIDTVSIFSYYSNGDSTIANRPTPAVNQPNTVNYTFSYLLDSTLMKNDYKFYYKIYAVDKGIVPEYSTMPVTGYYELVYNPNPVSIEGTGNTITNYTLEQNYPNPFNPITRINYSVKKDGLVEIMIYDVLGNKLDAIVKERKTVGKYSIDFNASRYSSGIYFYRLQVNDFIDTKKMILVK